MIFGKKKANKSIFVDTLKLGEQILDLSFYDYEDAFNFSEEHYSGTSKHFIEHFMYHSNEPKGKYEKDLIRYIYIKAIENRIASDIYGNTSRGNVCDVLRSPFDIHHSTYPTNLPRHLEAIVNSFQKESDRLAREIVSKIWLRANDDNRYEILNAVEFLGEAFGYHVGQENMIYQGYKCSEMLTRDEISCAAGRSLCGWLEENGFEINGVCFTREPYLSIMAEQECQKTLIVFSAEIAPKDPGFIKQDLDEAFSAAQRYGAIPYYACVNIGSSDSKHFDDGIILASDDIKYMVRAFDVLETE